MKKYICLVMTGLALWLVFESVKDFDEAENWLQIFKALFWMFGGSLAGLAFLRDYKKSKGA